VEMDGISLVTTTGMEMCGLGGRCSSGQANDSDHESVVSDYSEMADPVKEHLASIHLLQEAELLFGNSIFGLPTQQSYAVRPWLAMQRRPDEDEVEFLQRQRKMNFLSLAQEFAAIKKVNPNALPFIARTQTNDISNVDEGENEDSVDVSLAKEFAAVSCSEDKNDDEVSQSGADEFHVNDRHLNQSSDIAINNDICSAMEAYCNSESVAMVSSIPDVVPGLHIDGSCCDISQQSHAISTEVDGVGDYQSSCILSGTDDCLKTSGELAINSVFLHSRNVDLVSYTQYTKLLLLIISSGRTHIFFVHKFVRY